MLLKSDPWPYIIVDDYFPEDDFNLMAKEISELNLDDFQKPITIKVDEEISAHPHTYNCLTNSKLSGRAEGYLKDFENKRPYGNTSILQSFTVCKDGTEWGIHDEAPHKILSITVYVSPEESNGTLVYDRDKNLVMEVEWKPNRALIFCGITGLTWHSYYCNTQYRATVNEFVQRN